MESGTNVSLMTCTFDRYLITVLASYLDLETLLHTVSLLCKQFRAYIAEGGVDFIWKKLFLQEFLYENYSDH